MVEEVRSKESLRKEIERMLEEYFPKDNYSLEAKTDFCGLANKKNSDRKSMSVTIVGIGGIILGEQEAEFNDIEIKVYYETEKLYVNKFAKEYETKYKKNVRIVRDY